jgi:four helix bundle protein
MRTTYKNLLVWQKAIDLVVAIYQLTEKYPREEIFGLISQIRRSAISIPYNIAEGRLRGSEKEFKQFLRVAFASGGELETQIFLSKQLPKTLNLDYSKVEQLLSEVMKMLNKLLSKIVATT